MLGFVPVWMASVQWRNGKLKRTEVSNAEIWCECFGKSISDMKPSDSYSIAALMTQVDGWERTVAGKRIPIYGRQRMYQRKE